MAWLISKAMASSLENSHFLPEQVEAFLGENFSDGDQCAQVPAVAALAWETLSQ